MSSKLVRNPKGNFLITKHRKQKNTEYRVKENTLAHELFVKYLNIKYVQINEDYYGNRKILPLSDSFFNKDATVMEGPYWEGGKERKNK